MVMIFCKKQHSIEIEIKFDVIIFDLYWQLEPISVSKYNNLVRFLIFLCSSGYREMLDQICSIFSSIIDGVAIK